MDSWTPLYAWDVPPKKKGSKKDKDVKEKKASGGKKVKATAAAPKEDGAAPGTQIPLKYGGATVEEIKDEE